ncbi:MAG: 2'-deoxycytidine 5'-triphosphate deaminase [Patescibacteria group bacterium]|nr:2'-deoxycytidine 5'-triphosphate deaminase [Patescibacteria group bacterium]
MILGVNKLLKLVKENNLVGGLCDRELNNPEGTGFDLRIGELYKISGNGYLGVEERQTCDIEKVAEHKEGEKNSYVIKSGDFYLMKTIEKINMPDNLLAEFKPRTTLQRMGIMFRASFADPGYSGELTFALANNGPCDVEIEMGARVCNVTFHEVKGETQAYRGQWQGGRVTADKKEKQV